MRISDWSSDVCSSDLLEHWSLWPVRASLLTGPPKSGRSHLGRIFQHWSSGDVIDDADLADEQMIFHAWNRAQGLRSEERRVGKECVRTCRSRGSQHH